MVSQVTISSETTFSLEYVKIIMNVRIQKVVVVVYMRNVSWHSPGDCDEMREASVSTVSISPEILAGYVPSICLERYRYRDLPRMTLKNAFLNIEVLIIVALPQEFSKHVFQHEFHTESVMMPYRPMDKV
jgi:hypothetical protein